MGTKVLKKVKNGKLYDDGTILIEKVRFSYPHLAKPYAGKNDKGDKGEPKYGVVAMLPKKTHGAVKDLCIERINELLKENKIKKIGPEKKFIKNGDNHENEEYDGHFIVSARETRRPPLRDADRSVVDSTEAAEKFYGGCWGTIRIRPWFQNNDYGKRVNAGLTAVQFYKDDEPFGEGRISDEDLDDDFEDYDEGDEDYDTDDDGDNDMSDL
ncbi:ssDNA-binding protein [uncultured Sulfitobacter sp.]|uniref:ssDNA-binding protein n=1 Tax=uncultured Sulfitobacter sp. TaxID=191468 RepID=UPI0025919FA7|nr:ssDNA-binding protein [uncultured Sulfitobacter sp.]